MISLLTSLGLSIPQQTVEPTEEDKLKETLCGVLKGLGFNIPEPSLPKEDLVDIRIRELKTALKEKEIESCGSKTEKACRIGSPLVEQKSLTFSLSL